jgi:hypothetical protein
MEGFAKIARNAVIRIALSVNEFTNEFLINKTMFLNFNKKCLNIFCCNSKRG